MKFSLLISAFFVALIGTVACTAVDFRHLYGDPATASAAVYTMRIGADTRYVNVVGGDIVQFVVGDKAFTWHFNVATTVKAFDLKEVAPPGILDRSVVAYVEPDPRYLSLD